MGKTCIHKEFIIHNLLGMHARPASLFVQTVAPFHSEVKVTNLATRNEADGRSVMSLLMLCAPRGTRIRVEISGDDCQELMQKISDLIEGGFSDD